jgi:transcriptional regulator GlxA family with amidase domain
MEHPAAHAVKVHGRRGNDGDELALWSRLAWIGRSEKVTPMERKNVGILIFDGVEVLDFAGPYEVFSRTRLEPGPRSRRSEASAPFRVFTVARTVETVTATGGLRVVPDFGFDDMPTAHLLVIPGGFGTRDLMGDEEWLDWIRRRADDAEQVASVCTGSLLLASAGLLRGRRATTHWGAVGLLAELDPSITVEAGARVVSDGIISSAGVAAGIDMAFQIVEMLHGREVADETAAYIEYPRSRAVERLDLG